MKMTIKKKYRRKLKLSIFLLLIIPLAVFFLNLGELASAKASGQKAELPFKTPYDEIPDYNYPYLIPPPKMISAGPGGMRRQKKMGPPKLFFVVTPAKPNIYWKERTYDFYTGDGWLEQNINTKDFEKNKKSSQEPLKFNVYRFLKRGHYKLDLIKPFTIQSDIKKDSFKVIPSEEYRLSLNAYGDYVLNIDLDKDAAIKYTALYYPPDFDINQAGSLEDVPTKIKEVYTQLPQDFPQTLKDIAQNIKKKADGHLSEEILLTYKFVQENVEYDINWGEGETIPPGYDMALWTYENKKGICTHFATLFIALARAQGIPSRLAVGFAGGKVKENSVFIYSSYAHAWAEVYLPNFGWIPIDPTKGAKVKNGPPKNKFDTPPEWSNGGNVRPDLKFTLDNEYEKEKEKEKGNKSDKNGSNNGGKGSAGGKGGKGGGANGGGFNGDINQLKNLDKWFDSEDLEKLQKEQEQTQQGSEKKNDNKTVPENKSKEEKERNNLISELAKNASRAIKANKGGFLLFVLAVFIAVLSLFYFRKPAPSKTKELEEKIKQRIKEIKKFVDIAKVIEKVKVLGEKSQYNAAIVYGYNEIADYIAYIFDLFNDPALTAREFENVVNQIKTIRSLNIIVENFEKAKYSKENSKKDYDEFLEALYQIAKQTQK